VNQTVQSAPERRESTNPTWQRTASWVWLGLAVIVLVAAVLRLTGIGQGLPHVVGSDEGFEIHRALRLGKGEFDFERVGKGGYFYLLFAEYAGYFAWLAVTGKVSSAADFAAHFARDLTPFWLIARVSTALIAVAIVIQVFVLGRRMFSATVGLFAAAVLSISTLHIAHSHVVNVDLPMLLLLIWTLQICYEWADPDSKARPVMLGVVFGSAVMTKLPAAVGILPILAANWLRCSNQSWRQVFFSRDLRIAGLAAAVVYFLGNPGMALNLGKISGIFMRDIMGILPADDLYAGSTSPSSHWLFYWHSLVWTIGLPVAVLAVVGMFYALLRRTRADIILLSLGIPYFLTVALAQSPDHSYSWYVLPLTPVAAILAARVAFEIVERLPESPRLRLGFVSAMTVILLIHPAAQTASWLRRYSNIDSRLVARQWIEDNIATGAKIFALGNPIREQSVSVPLRDSRENVLRLIEEVEGESKAKAEFLRLRSELSQGVPYNLVTALHSEPVQTLQAYEALGVRYFVLTSRFFWPEIALRDTKHPIGISQSRVALFEELNSNPGVRKIFSVDATANNRPGPSIEIYELEVTDHR